MDPPLVVIRCKRRAEDPPLDEMVLEAAAKRPDLRSEANLTWRRVFTRVMSVPERSEADVGARDLRLKAASLQAEVKGGTTRRHKAEQSQRAARYRVVQQHRRGSESIRFLDVTPNALPIDESVLTVARAPSAVTVDGVVMQRTKGSSVVEEAWRMEALARLEAEEAQVHKKPDFVVDFLIADGRVDPASMSSMYSSAARVETFDHDVTRLVFTEEYGIAYADPESDEDSQDSNAEGYYGNDYPSSEEGEDDVIAWKPYERMPLLGEASAHPDGVVDLDEGGRVLFEEDGIDERFGQMELEDDVDVMDHFGEVEEYARVIDDDEEDDQPDEMFEKPFDVPSVLRGPWHGQ